MVLLLNYLHWFILAAGVFLQMLELRSWLKRNNEQRKKTNWRLLAITIGTICLTFGSLVVQGSYTPRGSVPRIPVPVYEVKEDGPVIQDRLRNTVKPEEEAQRDFDKMVDWRSKKAEQPTDNSTVESAKEK